MEELIIKVNGKEYNVKVEETEEGKIKVYCGDDVYEVEAKSDIEPLFAENVKSSQELKQGEIAVKALLPGTIFSVDVKIGQEVKKGQPLAKLMAMKMENEITSPKDGKIKEVRIKKNDNVNKDDVLFIIE